MTEAELWHMQLLAVDNSISGVSVLLTVISGYFAVAYFVGRRLGRFQAADFDVFHAWRGAWRVHGAGAVPARRSYFIEQLNAQFGVHSYVPNTAVNYVSGTLMFLLIPAALFFMYQIRGNPQLGADRLDERSGASLTWTLRKPSANAVRSDGGMVRGVAGGGLIGGPGRKERGLGEIRTDQLEAERRAGRRSPHGQCQ